LDERGVGGGGRNSHVYKLKRLTIGGAHLFLFCDSGSKEVLLLTSAQCSKKFGVPFQKKEKKV